MYLEQYLSSVVPCAEPAPNKVRATSFLVLAFLVTESVWRTPNGFAIMSWQQNAHLQSHPKLRLRLDWGRRGCSSCTAAVVQRYASQVARTVAPTRLLWALSGSPDVRALGYLHLPQNDTAEVKTHTTGSHLPSKLHKGRDSLNNQVNIDFEMSHLISRCKHDGFGWMIRMPLPCRGFGAV